MTPDEHRRRIDTVLDSSFVDSIDDLPDVDLRERLRDARSEEDALSYIRRNLHGRLDLLRAEVDRRRRGGDAGGSLDALAAALTDTAGSTTRGGRAGLGLRAAAVAGRRRAEHVLSEDHLARLHELTEEEIDEVVDRVLNTEKALSSQRRRLHEVIDALEGELARRYKAGLEPSLDRLQ